MCTSASTTFAWVGAILVNIGYLTVIWWGASKKWPLGFTLSALYALVLFGLANYFYKKEVAETSPDMYRPLQEAIQEEEEQQLLREEPEVGGDTTGTGLPTTQFHQEEPSQERTISVLVSLLFGLAVIALGVTGSFLPINLFHSTCDDYGWKPQWQWTTNITNLPEGLQSWAKVPYKYEQPPSFAYLSDAKATFFSGIGPTPPSDSQESGAQLWKTHPYGPPDSYSDILAPTNFIAVSNSTICFQAVVHANYWEPPTIQCTDGLNFSEAVDTEKRHHYGYFNFFVLDGILWAKEIFFETGYLVYSIDPTTMIMELHSAREDINYNEKSCRSTMREQASLSLLVVALPVVIVSASVWRSKQIPSMGLTTAIGMHLVYGALVVMIDPKNFDKYPLWDWWCTISGALWVSLLSFYVIIDEENVAKGPKRWGLVVGGLTYMLGTYMLIFHDFERDTLFCWVSWNLTAFIPMILIGAATRATFLMFLGAFGFLIDAARLSEFAGEKVHGDLGVPIQFLVFSVAGILVGGLGMLLNNYQPDIERFAFVHVTALRERCARRSVAPIEEADEDFADIDSPLLHSDDNP